jgi:signal transduction histidine kinase
MLNIEAVEMTIENLADIRQAIVGLKPNKSEALKLDRIYNAILQAERELGSLTNEVSHVD